MRLTNYGRNHKKRKEYIKQSRGLLAGVDVSKGSGVLNALRCDNKFFIDNDLRLSQVKVLISNMVKSGFQIPPTN